MEFNIHVGKRVLYKHNNQWEVGVLTEVHNTKLTEKGLYLSIIPKEFIDMPEDKVPYMHDAEINDIFLDAQPVEDWMKQYHYLMTKEEYIEFIESDDFEYDNGHAWVSDGEYYYYPISKYNANWILKQPFNYVLRGE